MSKQSELVEAGPARPWPTEGIEYWAIERVIPYADNARLHRAGIVARGWRRAYWPADNQLAARACRDFALLRSELEEFGFGGFDLGLIGFEPDQLEPILAGSRAAGSSSPGGPLQLNRGPSTLQRRTWLQCTRLNVTRQRNNELSGSPKD